MWHSSSDLFGFLRPRFTRPMVCRATCIIGLGAHAQSDSQQVHYACLDLASSWARAHPPACLKKSAANHIGSISLNIKAMPCKTTGGSLSGVLRQTASTQPELGPDIAQLAASLHLYAPDIVQVKIIDPASSRWEVPASLFGKLPGSAPIDLAIASQLGTCCHPSLDIVHVLNAPKAIYTAVESPQHMHVAHVGKVVTTH